MMQQPDITRVTSLTQTFAAWAVNVRQEALPENVREKARICCLDWIAAAASGAGHPLAETYVRLARTLSGNGKESIVARREKASRPFAIFANAALGHITETDDGHRWSIVHPGAVVFPVVASLASTTDQPGRAAVEGAVVGYEAAIRLGLAFGPGHYDIWHTTATAGVFGAAAAAAKIMGLDPPAFTDALGHAGTQSAGVWQFLKDNCASAKPFHPAQSCLSGYIAATAAAGGIPGAPYILEGGKGLFAALGRSPQPEQFTHDLGKKYVIEEVNCKPYPTCGQTHSMIDAMTAIIKKHKLAASQVLDIEARIYTKAADIAGNPNPANLEEAKFSIPFCLAYLLVKGKIPFTGMTDADVFNESIRSLMAKTRLVTDPAMEAGFPDARPCKINVATSDGRILSADNQFRKGDPEKPFSFTEIAEKFRELAAGVYSSAKMDSIIDSVRCLCRNGNVSSWPDLSL